MVLGHLTDSCSVLHSLGDDGDADGFSYSSDDVIVVLMTWSLLSVTSVHRQGVDPGAFNQTR